MATLQRRSPLLSPLQSEIDIIIDVINSLEQRANLDMLYTSGRRGDQEERRRDDKLADLAMEQGLKLRRAREGLRDSVTVLR